MKLVFESDYWYKEDPIDKMSSDELMKDRNNDGYRNFLSYARQYFTDEKFRENIMDSDRGPTGWVTDSWKWGDWEDCIEYLYQVYKAVYDDICSENHFKYAKRAKKDILSGKYDFVKNCNPDGNPISSRYPLRRK